MKPIDLRLASLACTDHGDPMDERTFKRCGYCVNSVSPVRMDAFEFGDLGPDVVAPLDQQIVVRDLFLYPLWGRGGGPQIPLCLS
jgi:hypothetical protein